MITYNYAYAFEKTGKVCGGEQDSENAIYNFQFNFKQRKMPQIPGFT